MDEDERKKKLLAGKQKASMKRKTTLIPCIVHVVLPFLILFAAMFNSSARGRCEADGDGDSSHTYSLWQCGCATVAGIRRLGRSHRRRSVAVDSVGVVVHSYLP